MPRKLILRFPPAAEPVDAGDGRLLHAAAARALDVEPGALAEVREAAVCRAAE